MAGIDPGAGGCQEIGFIAAVRASRRARWALLSMRKVLDGVKKIPRPEEAAQQLSRRMRGADPANRQFPYILLRRGEKRDKFQNHHIRACRQLFGDGK